MYTGLTPLHHADHLHASRHCTRRSLPTRHTKSDGDGGVGREWSVWGGGGGEERRGREEGKGGGSGPPSATGDNGVGASGA